MLRRIIISVKRSGFRLKLTNISTKVILLLIIIIALLTISLGLFLYQRESKRMIKTLQDNSGLVVERLANSLELPLWNFYEFELDKLIENEIQNRDILAIIVYDEAIELLKVFMRNKRWDIVEMNTREIEDVLPAGIYMKIEKKVVRNNKEIGTLLVYFTDYYLKQDLNAIIFSILGLTGILAVFILIATYYTIHRFVLNPLNLVHTAVNSFEGEDFSTKLAIQSNDEFEDISISFNNMKNQIKKSFNEINFLKNYFSCIIDSMPSVIISTDKNGVITQWNAAAAESTGITAAEAIGQILWDITGIFDKYKKHYPGVIEKDERRIFHKERIVKGNVRYQDVSLFPLKASGITGVVLRIDDVTELVKKDELLIQAQKMESIGNLAGGMAHDFNNVLGGIIGTVSLIQYYIKQKKKIDLDLIKKNISIIEESAGRASDMVKQLLAISRRQELLLKPVDLIETIEDVIKICERTLDKKVEIKSALVTEKAVIKADMTQIEQVLLNLCINAAHAMTIMRGDEDKKGGVLSINLARIYADKYFCISHPEAENIHYWVIEINDNGIGMDSRTIAKIFDPFFTTKEKGKGSGLGLSMVYNIIQQHGGFIDVYSEKGLGSTFSIYLPEFSGGETGMDIVNKHEVISNKSGLILVVDDDEIMQITTSNILEELGYRVMIARDGEEGVKIFEENYMEIDVVILDIAMPRKSGKEAYKEMKEIFPDLKVLVASGYKKESMIQELLDMGVNGFLHKPYSMKELAEKLGGLL